MIAYTSLTVSEDTILGVMAEEYLLGVDVGTYESKGVLTTIDGRVVGVQTCPHELLIPRPGWAEHDAEGVWWGDFVVLVHRLLRTTGIQPGQIRAIGCSAIGPDLLPVDQFARPLRQGAILYGIDTRATREIAELEAHFGKDTIFAQSANALSAQSIGPKLLWLKQHEPETFARAHRFLTGTSFLVARLTGRFVIDHLTAATWTPLYDFHNQSWHRDMAAEIVELERLPELAWASEIAGTVTLDAARETGLAAGTPVIVGSVDAAVEALSVGVTDPGQMMLMYGSTVFMIEVLAKPTVDPRLWSVPYLFPGTACLEAGMATSGALTRWFRDKLAPDLVTAEATNGDDAYEILTQQASLTPAGAEGLIVLPYFSGERTPINDPWARGIFFGLTLAHSRAHMFRAVLEGIGYGIQHHFDVLESIGARPQEVIAVGGGTKSALWLQIVSDITGVTQRVPAVTLGAAYGDAFLAGLGTGAVPSYTDIHTWVRDFRLIHPNLEHVRLYHHHYRLYLELYRRNKDLMRALHETD